MTIEQLEQRKLEAWNKFCTGPTPEERNRAGREYVRLADEMDRAQ